MLTFYPDIKLVHVAAIMASGAFFALRALALLGGMRWPRQAQAMLLALAMFLFLILIQADEGEPFIYQAF